MRIHFGEYCLESDTRQLTRGGEPVQLSPKAFQLLQYLLEMRPKALSVRELYKHVWPDTHVEKANLRNLIAEVRTAIHDQARPGRWIRTVFGFGYAFAGEARTDAGPRAASSFQLIHGTVQHRLVEGENVIGRDPDAGIVIDALGISRRHAKITVHGSQLLLEDLASKNGTFVNEERVHGAVAIRHGDEVRLGLLKTTVRAMTSDWTTATEI
jgi:DNA-binding winged helix-turn-helix (wHTH) protein